MTFLFSELIPNRWDRGVLRVDTTIPQIPKIKEYCQWTRLYKKKKNLNGKILSIRKTGRLLMKWERYKTGSPVGCSIFSCPQFSFKKYCIVSVCMAIGRSALVMEFFRKSLNDLLVWSFCFTAYHLLSGYLTPN